MGALAAYGAVLGCTGVVTGAFGSHYLKAKLTEDRLKSWQIAVQYQLLHGAVIFATGLLYDLQMRKNAAHAKAASHLGRSLMLWSAGTTLFSGSIYLLCLGYKGILGPLTPLGGVVMIGGWASAVLAALAL